MIDSFSFSLRGFFPILWGRDEFNVAGLLWLTWSLGNCTEIENCDTSCVASDIVLLVMC